MSINKELDPDDGERFKSWYLKYYTWLCEYLEYINSKNKDKITKVQISDLAMDTLMTLLQATNCGKFIYQGEGQLRNWLKNTARFTLSNNLRKRKLTIVDFDLHEEYIRGTTNDFNNPLELLEEKLYKDELLRYIFNFMRTLPDPDRELLMLYYAGPKKMKGKKIAEIMDRKESWVKGRSHWLRKKLKAHLAEKGFGEA